MQEQEAAGPAREAPQRRAARGGRLQAGLRRRQAAAAAAAAAAQEDSDEEPGRESDGEVPSNGSIVEEAQAACPRVTSDDKRLLRHGPSYYEVLLPLTSGRKALGTG